MADSDQEALANMEDRRGRKSLMAEASQVNKRARGSPVRRRDDIRVECFTVAGHAESRGNLVSMLNAGWGGYVVKKVPTSLP